MRMCDPTSARGFAAIRIPARRAFSTSSLSAAFSPSFWRCMNSVKFLVPLPCRPRFPFRLRCFVGGVLRGLPMIRQRWNLSGDLFSFLDLRHRGRKIFGLSTLSRGRRCSLRNGSTPKDRARRDAPDHPGEFKLGEPQFALITNISGQPEHQGITNEEGHFPAAWNDGDRAWREFKVLSFSFKFQFQSLSVAVWNFLRSVTPRNFCAMGNLRRRQRLSSSLSNPARTGGVCIR